MKKLFFFLTISILVLNSVKAQTNVYHPFPIAHSTWTEVFAPSTGGTQISQYGIFGDTILGTHQYHKLYNRSINPCFSPDTMSAANSFLMGALGEDSLKRVYLYSFNHPYCDSIRKIYDFSKQMPGDTIQFDTAALFFNCYAYHYLIIDYIDSILINNAYRKQYHFLEQGETWIEGIGSKRSLLSTISPYLTCSCTNLLVCNLQNDSLYYFNNNPNPSFHYCLCSYPINIKDYGIDKTFKISPNPFTTQTILQFDYNLNNTTIIIYNIVGQQVKQIKNINGQSITIQRDNLPSGLYFIDLLQDNKITVSGKLVVVD